MASKFDDKVEDLIRTLKICASWDIIPRSSVRLRQDRRKFVRWLEE